MYYYPLLLISDNDIRNNEIADLIQIELENYNDLEKRLLTILPDHVPKKVLTELTEIDLLTSKIILELLRCNISIFLGSITELQKWKILEKIKKVLSILRRDSLQIIHPFDGYSFSDIVRKSFLWEEHDSLKTGDAKMWHAVLISRLSDIHRNISKLTFILKPYIIAHQYQLKHIYGNETLANDLEQMKFQVSHILEHCRHIFNEVLQYTTFVNNL